jgi:F0F1-type ATP synthase assembly protein I
MPVNALLYGQIVLIFAIIMVVLGYYLGKRKTQTPKLSALAGLLSAFIPPLAIIYLMALILKDDAQ